jgi:hypothetical protein
MIRYRLEYDGSRVWAVGVSVGWTYLGWASNRTRATELYDEFIKQIHSERVSVCDEMLTPPGRCD